jgi:RNA polymerase-binding transcription factor DksA
MNDKALERYRLQLQSLLDRLDSEVDQIAETVRIDARPQGEHDRLVSESPDKELALERNVEDLRRQVLEALKRIESKTFGTCVSCGRPLAPARLAALPYVATCVACEHQRESAPRGSRGWRSAHVP